MIKHDAGVSGPDGLSGFEELRRRKAARSTILYAVDLVGTGGRFAQSSELVFATIRLDRVGLPSARASSKRGITDGQCL